MFTKQHHKIYSFTVVIEHDKDGFFAYAPELQGCHTQGDTYEEIVKNIREAIELSVEARLAHNEPILDNSKTTIAVSNMTVAV